MAVTKYTYSISTDFTGLVAPYTRPDLGALTYQIQTSSIVTALKNIDTVGDACDIYFNASLSSEDETTLDAIVAAHTGAPLTPALPIQPVKEIDTSGLNPDTANTKLKGYEFVADGKTEGEGAWTNFDFSFPYDVDVLMGEGIAPPDGADGDEMEFYVAPDLIVGQVAADASSGQPDIYFNASALQNLKPGFFVRIGAATDDLHEIGSIDYTTGKVTLTSDLEEAKTTDDYVLRTIKYCESISMTPGEVLNLGGQTSGSVFIPASTTLRVRYYNTQSTDTDVTFRIILKY